MFIGNNDIFIKKFVSFYINEYYCIFPYSLLNEIIKVKIFSKLDCKLFLLDQRGIYGIKCHKNEMKDLPNIYFVFSNNYTFNIPSNLLFEDYDVNYKVSIFRNKLKYENNGFDEDEEIIIGYSLIKYFN